MATRAGPQEGELTLGQLLTRSLRNADKVTRAPAPNDARIQASTHTHSHRGRASALCPPD